MIEYFELVAALENQISKEKPKDFVSKGLSMKRLFVWTCEPLQKLRLMSVLIDLCDGI